MKSVAAWTLAAALGILLTVQAPVLTQALITIVALGDSTTAGTPGFKSPLEAPPDGNGDVESQYPYWLGRANAAWRVLNRGIDGQRADQIRSRFKADVLDVRPELVVIIAGANDIYQGRPVHEVKADLQAMYDLAKGAGIPVVAGSIIPFNTATPGQNASMADVNAWIALAASRDPNIAFADTRAAVAASGQPDRLASSPDGLHPSPEGYQRMAGALGPAVEAALRRRRRR